MPQFTAHWEVEDGYAGKSRPQHTKIDTNDQFEDDEWEEMSEKEKKEWIEEQVEEDYRNKISFYISDYGIK